jgi:hypothetical protein
MPGALKRLIDAAIQRTGNDDIQHLHEDDASHIAAVSLDIKFNWPNNTPSKTHEQEFAGKRSDWLQRTKSLSCDEGGCMPAHQAYDFAMSDFNKYLTGLKPEDEHYNDLLDSYIDVFTRKLESEPPHPGDFSALGAFTMGRRINNKEIWMDVGAGQNAFRVLYSLSQHPDAGNARLIIVDNEPVRVCRAAERYAERLKLKNVTVLHADAGSRDFQLKLRKLLGDNKVKIIRENQMFMYLPDAQPGRTVDDGVRNFLKACHHVLDDEGALYIGEYEHFSPTPFTASHKAAYKLREEKRPEYYWGRVCDVRKLAEGLFDVHFHRLKENVPKPLAEPVRIHRLTFLQKRLA